MTGFEFLHELFLKGTMTPVILEEIDLILLHALACNEKNDLKM